MHIVIADGLPASAIEILQQPDWNIDNRQGRPPAELTADLQNADALVVRSATKVTRTMIDAAPRLRVIARAGTGVDNVDVPAATARGIVVMNAPGANSLSVAELAMGLHPVDGTEYSCGRRIDEDLQMGEIEIRRSRDSVKDPRTRRTRTHRTGGGGTRSRVRDERHRPRSIHLGRNVGDARGRSLCRSMICARGPITSRSTCRRCPRRSTSLMLSGSRSARRASALSIRRAAS